MPPLLQSLLARASLQESQVPKIRGKGWSKEDISLVEEDQVREYFSKLDVQKSNGPDGMHPRVLREFADVIVKPLSIIFEQLREVPEDWRKADVIPVFRESQEGGPRELQASQPHLSPWEGDGAVNSGNHFPDTFHKDTKVIRSSQHGFTKGMSCLTRLINFYGKMTGLVDEGRAVDSVYLDFSKASNTVSR